MKKETAKKVGSKMKLAGWKISIIVIACVVAVAAVVVPVVLVTTAKDDNAAKKAAVIKGVEKVSFSQDEQYELHDEDVEGSTLISTSSSYFNCYPISATEAVVTGFNDTNSSRKTVVIPKKYTTTRGLKMNIVGVSIVGMIGTEDSPLETIVLQSNIKYMDAPLINPDSNSKLVNILVTKENTSFCDEKGVLYKTSNGAKTKLVRYFGSRSATSFDVPSGVTTIGAAAFFACKNLTYIGLPDTVSSIESAASMILGDSGDVINIGAFEECSSLNNVSLPHDMTVLHARTFANCDSLTWVGMSNTLITKIEQNAFSGCDKLGLNLGGSGVNTIELPSGLQEIEQNVFLYCQLTKIVLPATCTTIGDDALQFSIVNITVYAPFSDSLANAINDINSRATIIVPASELTAWQTWQSSKIWAANYTITSM